MTRENPVMMYGMPEPPLSKPDVGAIKDKIRECLTTTTTRGRFWMNHDGDRLLLYRDGDEITLRIEDGSCDYRAAFSMDMVVAAMLVDALKELFGAKK